MLVRKTTGEGRKSAITISGSRKGAAVTGRRLWEVPGCKAEAVVPESAC